MHSGSEEALGTLLRANAHQAFLYALSNLSAADSQASKSAFARGLRVLAIAVADTIGPSQWGLKKDTCSVRHEAKFALEYLFKVIHLPCAVVAHLCTNECFFPARRPGCLSSAVGRSIAQLKHVNIPHACVYPMRASI